MNQQINEQLKKLKKETELESYLWKPTKSAVGVPMIDASEEDLKKWYTHCCRMISNTAPLGRKEVLGVAVSAKNICLGELFYRELSNPHDFYASLTALLETPLYLKNFPPTEYATTPIGQVIHIDEMYSKLSVQDIRKSCLRLYKSFPKALLTLSFLGSCGISDPEATPNNVHEKLKISKAIAIPIIEKGGLTLDEFKKLKVLTKVSTSYSSINTSSLKTLVYIVLPKLIKRTDKQLLLWEGLKYKIRAICNYKQIDLPNE